MPRIPKPPELRQRRNRESTRALLPSAADAAENEVPELPERESKAEKWHPLVVKWWKSVWRSPMASEFLAADKHGGLYNLAELYQRRYTVKDTKELVAVIAEIRQQEVRFGLSPIDRRRLQWEIEKGEQADERTARRRGLRQTEGKDPRDVLKVAK